MSKWRVVLQPTTKVNSSVAVTQDQRFAIQSGAAKTVLVWINVFENTTAAPTFFIYGASASNLDDDVSTNSFWKSQGSVQATASTTGAFTFSFTNPPAFLKWHVTTAAATDFRFEVILEMWDT